MATKKKKLSKCPDHPKYRGIRKPRISWCDDCKEIYETKHPGFKFPCSICRDTGWQQKSDCHYDTWYTECTYCDRKPTIPYPGNY